MLAKAGIQKSQDVEGPSADREIWGYWIPAFAGMTRPHTYFALTRSRSRRPATRKTRLVAMPRRWLAGAAGTTPMAMGAANAVILPEKEKKPKNSVILSGGERRASSVRLDAWIGPEAKPMRMAKAR